MDGAAKKSVPLMAGHPAGVVTTILPDTAPGGTAAFRDVEVLFVIDVAGTPPNVTLVAPPRFVPVIVTFFPGFPVVGVNPDMVATTLTVKLELLVAAPCGVVIEIGPVAAP